MVFRKLPFTAVLLNRNFFYLLSGQILSQLASNISLFLLGLIVYQDTGSNTAVSALFMAYGIPSVLFGMFAGTVVDYIDKRTIILYSCLIRMVLVIGLLFVTNNIFLVYILLFANAIVTQFFVPAESTMIPKIVPVSQLVPANSLFSFAYYSSMAIGFILAGPMLRFFGPYWSLGILAFFFLIASLTALRLPKTKEGNQLFKKMQTLNVTSLVTKVFLSLKNGVIYLRQTPILFDSVILLTGAQIIIVMLSTLGPGFADKVMGIPIVDASLYIVGPAVVGMLVGVFWVGGYGHRYGSKHLITTGILSSGLVLLAISTTVYLKRFTSFGWFFSDTVIIPVETALFFLLGAFNSFLDVPANSTIQKEAVGDMRGRVYGVLTAFVGGVGILPVMVSGLIADVIGVGKVIAFLGIAITVYGIIRLRYMKKGAVPA